MPRQSARNKRDLGTTTNGTAKTSASEASVKSSTKRKASQVENEPEKDTTDVKQNAKPAKQRKTGKGKAADQEATPLVERTNIGSLKKAMYIGAHVSSAGGVQNSVSNAMHIGANAFALFLKSQRKWANPPLADEARDGFKAGCETSSFEPHKHCLPHGSYLVNLAQADKEKADQAYGAFVDDLQRCESLGIRLYNFHPGNTNGDTKSAAVSRIAAQLNKAHRATKSVVTVLENMAGQGNVVGSTFEDLRDIISQVDDKTRVAVCIDTCHAFAAGYDLRDPESFRATFESFDSIVGRKYLAAFHLNDSKAPLDSNRDLHANIGTGFLGLRAFHTLVNDESFAGLPMVLETPIDSKGADGKSVEDKQVWADEIKLLESLIDMDAEGDEFKALSEKLQKQGASERAKVQDQVDLKAAKDSSSSSKSKGGAAGKKKK